MTLHDALPIVINLAKAAVAYDSSDESEPAEQMDGY